MYPQPINRLVSELATLPGIGQRTAQRLAFHILRSADADAGALADAIREVQERVGVWEVGSTHGAGPRCGSCEDPRRDRSLTCAGVQPADVSPVGRAVAYRGRDPVLGGALSPSDGVGPEALRIAALVERARDGEV